MRWLFMTAILVSAACTSADAAAPTHGHPIASSLPLRSAPRVTLPVPTPPFTPGGSYLSGTIADVDLPWITVRTVDRGEVLVDLAAVRSVWKETFVTASSLERGDDVFIDGAGGAPFYAFNVNANIGRLDGVITAIRGEAIELDQLARSGATIRGTVTLSQYIQPLGPWRISDLRPGMAIGAVVYRARDGSRRITRIWSD
jgi:hypothetical protein